MIIEVLVVDDQPLVRSALRMVVAEVDDMVIAGEAETGEEAVRLTRELKPDVVLMDLRMPGMGGIEATGQIVRLSPETRVLVLTTFDEDDHVFGALQAGAAGFLIKNMSLDDILDAVRTVAHGNGLLAPSVTRRLIKHVVDTRTAPTVPRRPLSGITEREREVLTLVGRGLSNSEIADELRLSHATVKTYITRLLSKLGARDRVHLVIAAYEAGLATVAIGGPGVEYAAFDGQEGI
ncbi:response regulator [Salinispora tropica]|uniref:Response regulator receiver n=1 Tax=Salinispora tropica (strain ATCC BAA-916 / DSM 44818 / JCM 13857 / NBRC 105044 / CNB-440) TaxID=369723 RepID=A4XCA4_SALTO|nr:response regulator transcription factor [Salinispora tropica]ABP56561.1 response regulator receiver [Salinispora tropica CNB-440]